ncbi:PAS domain S-box protein [Bacillus sp. FJAT-42376]|uniref:ATP-binding protein n=1 Tax=Bacillus sp. FJAT-42376 TaxID=2014076 RepID=UPI000F4D89E7|nr:ATP-binding protein [Bacillus sp. FJAT-42376]AZB42086.1 PAS domain S-box protein [Bacillus sp. FJAT-42376]
MEFILLFAISLIPLTISFTILYFANGVLTRALSLFLLMLSFWQIDISVLYAYDLLNLAMIDFIFRAFRAGPVFIMPIVYFFAYQIVKENRISSFIALFVNKAGLVLVTSFSTLVYLINYTNYGIQSYASDQAKTFDLPHWFPVYGEYSILFKINVLFVFINTFLLLIATIKVKNQVERSFYFKLVIAALIIFLNGLLSGFSFIPLFFSSLNSIFATVLLFVSFFKMQSKRITFVNRKLSRQSSLLESIMDISPNCIIVKNRRDIIVRVNDTFCDIFQVSRDELIGSPYYAMAAKHHFTEAEQEAQQSITEYRGRARWIQWEVKRILEDQGEIYTLYFGIDITEQKQNEQILLSSEKLKVLGEMAASVAHEIRNPLTTIRGFIQLLKERNTQSNFEHIILDEIDRINQVLKELLVLAKPEAKQKLDAAQSPANVLEEIKNLHLLTGPLAIEENKEMKMENRLSGSAAAYMHKDYFKQVFINLIKNSLEATSEKGKIKIILDDTPSQIRVRVIDNGIGMSKDLLEKIGEPYYTNKEKGTGIGLTICFKLIRENNGTLTVKSKSKMGTAITVCIPKAPQVLS